MLRGDVIAVRRQPAEVRGALVHERKPPVGQVRGDLNPDVRHEPPALANERPHVVERYLRRPRGQGWALYAPTWGQNSTNPGAPLRLLGDLRRLLAVVAPMRHEILEDDLLEMAVLRVDGGQRLERLDPIGLALADPHEDPARERDAELAGRADRLEPQRRV